MRRLLASVLLGLLLGLAPTQVALAHPLGNFTINHYAGLTVRTDVLLVDYVLDLAEIPAFQLRATIERDVPRACADLTAGLRAQVDSATVALRTTGSALTFPPGQGGLDTLRLECAYRAGVALASGLAHALAFSDANYAERIGWREITARGEGTLVESALPRESVSARLTAYPQDLLTSPLDVRAATLRVTALAAAAPRDPDATSASPAGRPADAFASLITRGDLGPLGLLLALVVAVGLGAFHALTPGHGKTVMAAYLVGTRGTRRQALWLGLAVALSHTVGVLALGALTLAGTAVLAPERAYPYLSVLSAALVLALGAWMVATRARHAQAHRNGHPHDHADGGVSLGWRSLAALGLAGGIVPSASALVLLLGAITLHRVELGLVLIVAFGVGMAATLVGIGMALVGARGVAERAFARHERLALVLAFAPTAAAVLVLLLGLGMTAQSVGALL